MIKECPKSEKRVPNREGVRNKKRCPAPLVAWHTVLFIQAEWNCKPGSVLDDHLSRIRVATNFKQPTWAKPGRLFSSIWSCFGWGLHSLTRYRISGGLLHRLFTLTAYAAVIFCCTFLRVTSTGRYPASCPAKPGLSSHPNGAAIVCFTQIMIILTKCQKIKPLVFLQINEDNLKTVNYVLNHLKTDIHVNPSI